MEYTYDQMYQRNIGIFTPEEQERTKNLKVAIAGTGGLGGELAYLLTRLGVMSIRLCDPEVFEISNINRQFGCYIDTIGQNKAIAVSKELLRINSNLNIKVWDYGINESNAKEFIDGYDIVIDAIDFYAIDKSIILQEEARKQKVWVMSSQIAGSMMSTINISPDGPHFGDLFIENGKISMDKVVSILFPILPKEATPDLIERVINGEKMALTSWSHAPVITAIILLEDLVSCLIKKENNLLSAPIVTIFDINNKKFEVKNA